MPGVLLDNGTMGTVCSAQIGQVSQIIGGAGSVKVYMNDMKEKLKPVERNIRFVELSTLKKLGRWPRYPDDDALTTDLSLISLNRSLVVYISHCSAVEDSSKDPPSNDEECAEKYIPDNKSNDKYTLCVKGVDCLRRVFAHKMDYCYVWFDYSCLDQNQSDPVVDFEKHANEIISSCDCVFTPIVDYDDRSALPPPVTRTSEDITAFREHYGADAWRGESKKSYLSRAWCRLEMW